MASSRFIDHNREQRSSSIEQGDYTVASAALLDAAAASSEAAATLSTASEAFKTEALSAASARRPAAEDWAWSSRRAYAAPAVSAAIGLLCDELRSRGEEAWRVLRRLDSNGSGTISRSEMARGLREIGLTLRAGAPLPAHCLRRRLRLTCAASFGGRALVGRLWPPAPGSRDSGWQSPPLCFADELTAVMREFDRNGDGLVDYHEMLKACGCWDPARAASSNAASARRTPAWKRTVKMQDDPTLRLCFAKDGAYLG
jgi:hypothetical protein